MDFFGIGTWELLVIGILALAVLGPRQLIQLARKAGELLRQFQLLWAGTSVKLQDEIKSIDDMKEVTGLANEIRAVGKSMTDALRSPDGHIPSPPVPAAPGGPLPAAPPPPPSSPYGAWTTDDAPPPDPSSPYGAWTDDPKP